MLLLLRLPECVTMRLESLGTIIYLVLQIFGSKYHSASRNEPIFIILLPMERPDS